MVMASISEVFSVPQFRKVSRILTSQPTIEGGGVRLKRAFADDKLLDPFLLLDEFHSHDPEDYAAGFPSHPHRGFETVTYVLEGAIEHQDSAGNRGTINAGEVQWMTAGRGIVHQEMPRGDSKGRLWGVQLWVNLPAAQKMIPPRYRGITKNQIPQIQVEPHTLVRIICGTVEGQTGPVRDLAVGCEFLDISMEPNSIFSHATPPNYRTFAYVLDGVGNFGSGEAENIGLEHTVVYDRGLQVKIQTGNRPLRCLLVGGQPINEPVAWQGSIVMNSPDELYRAYQQLRNDQFLNP